MNNTKFNMSNLIYTKNNRGFVCCYNTNEELCTKSIHHYIDDYVPIYIIGTRGEYADIVNGQYIPIINQLTHTIYYKKSNNSNIRIEYHSYCHSWKIVINRDEIAQIKPFVKQVPLDTLYNITWLVRTVEDDEPTNIQFGIQIFI